MANLHTDKTNAQFKVASVRMEREYVKDYMKNMTFRRKMRNKPNTRREKKWRSARIIQRKMQTTTL